ncbi:hypothetical protein PYW07_015802 [Mythimna separata]|uniref:Uncharacterized protein n=1 Tax=Mythimna separata TaxID=271217 RepID=A0AAD7YSJ2_MYTSE|nr:hypothetical protein PYW07_015802 [Mythimna separata]
MKFVLVVLCAVILVASSQMISLEDLLKAYEVSSSIDTNEIGTGNGGNPVKVASEALFIPMSLRSCTSGACNFVCKFLGYKYGTCISSETCRCYS